MKIHVVLLFCAATLAASVPTPSTPVGSKAPSPASAQARFLYDKAGKRLLRPPPAPSPAEVAAAEEATEVVEGNEFKEGPPPAPSPPQPVVTPVQNLTAPSASDIYSKNRSVPVIAPQKATSLSGDEPDIDSSVRDRIEADSKKIGLIAENLVGVQGDINHVEKEVLGKVFDMSSMKSFLSAHEASIKEHEKLDQEQEDLNKQATSLSKQLDNAINETSRQDGKHRAKMIELTAQVAEDKAVIQGLQRELIPLVEMQKEVEKLPPINANQTAQNTKAVAAAQAATEEVIYEKAKIKTYQETTKNLMKELVKQHDYATKCHTRLYELNTHLHDIATKEAQSKFEQGREASKGEAMEKLLVGKNKLLEGRLDKAKKNLATINFAKSNVQGKISQLQSEGEMQLEKLKTELGNLKQQGASIETAMMAKITNRKMIEKALRGATLHVEDMQARLLAGELDKLRRNNTQMSNDLQQIRTGMEKAQTNTARAESQRVQLLAQAEEMRQQAANTTAEAQEVAREALEKVVSIRETADQYTQFAAEASMEAQASMLTECSAVWTKQHPAVKGKLEKCQRTKLDLESARASVATLTQTVQSSQSTQ